MASVLGNVELGHTDDANLEIITEPGHSIPRQTHEPNDPAEATGIRGNKIRITGSLRRELFACALKNTWDKAQAIYAKNPDMVRVPLTPSQDTALHVAVIANNSTFVEELVNLNHMTANDLEIRNMDGNTAFCMAAITGKGDLFQIMIKKNKNLPVIRGHDEMLPVHLAASTGHHQIVEDLSSEDLLQEMTFKDIEQLFFATIKSRMYDVAMKLGIKYREKLVVARDEDQLTALHMLASKQFDIREKNSTKEASPGRGNDQLELFQKLWSVVEQLDYSEMLGLITYPSVVLLDAVESGNIEVVEWLLHTNPELLTIKDPRNGRNLLHVAALYDRRSIFRLLLEMGTVSDLLIRAVDQDHNNVLHFAAHMQKENSSMSSLSPHLQLDSETNWFREVEKRVPPELTTMRNRKGKTPIDLLHANQKEFCKDVTDYATRIANGGMVVAILVATIAFAAALTVPGDKSSTWFDVFIMANALALITSAAAIVVFLSTFMRPGFAFVDITIRGVLQTTLYNGAVLLFYCITAMVLAFVAASFLIFDHKGKAFPYAVICLAGFSTFHMISNLQLMAHHALLLQRRNSTLQFMADYFLTWRRQFGLRARLFL